MVGGKAINLAKLMQAKLPVPLICHYHRSFKTAENGKVSDELKEQISEAFETLELDNGVVLPQLQKIWLVLPWPASMRLT